MRPAVTGALPKAMRRRSRSPSFNHVLSSPCIVTQVAEPLVRHFMRNQAVCRFRFLPARAVCNISRAANVVALMSPWYARCHEIIDRGLRAYCRGTACRSGPKKKSSISRVRERRLTVSSIPRGTLCNRKSRQVSFFAGIAGHEGNQIGGDRQGSPPRPGLFRPSGASER
jgi:hypothetical protein